MDTIVLPLRGRPRLLLGEFFAAMDEDTSKEGVWKVEAFRTWSDGPSWMVTGEVSEEDRHGLWVLASFCEERTSATFLGETAEDQDLRRRLDRCRFLVHCPFATAWFPARLVLRPILVCHPSWVKINRVWPWGARDTFIMGSQCLEYGGELVNVCVCVCVCV